MLPVQLIVANLGPYSPRGGQMGVNRRESVVKRWSVTVEQMEPDEWEVASSS